MTTKQFMVRMESAGGDSIKSEFAGIGAAGEAAHDQIAQGARLSEQEIGKLNAELARETRAFRTLQAAIDPAYAAQIKYEKAVFQTQRATKLGIASKEEEARVLALLKQRHDQASAAMQRGAGDVANYGRTVDVSSMQTANLAAQWNDIGVMMASGQSPFILALQQGTQVSQVLNQMGSGRQVLSGLRASLLSVVNPVSLVTIGVIAGGAALGQWAMSAIEAGRQTVSFDDALDDLKGTIDALRESQDLLELSAAEMFGKYGENAEIIRRFGEAQAELRVAETSAALLQQVNVLDQVASGYVLIDRGQRRFSRELSATIGRITEDFDVTRSVAAELEAAFRGAVTAIKVDDQLAAMENLLDVLEENEVAMSQLPPELRKGVDETITLTRQMVAAQQAANALKKEIADSGESAKLLGSQIAGLDFSPAVADAIRLHKAFGVSIQSVLILKGLVGEAAQAYSDAARPPILDPRDPDFQEVPAQLARLAEFMKTVRSETRKATPETQGFAGALENAAKGAKTLEKDLEKAKSAAEAFDLTLQDAVLTSEQFGVQSAQVVLGGVDQVADAIGDLGTRSLDSLSELKDRGVQIMRSMLSEMVTMAARQRIMVSMGITGVPGGGAAPVDAIRAGTQVVNTPFGLLGGSNLVRNTFGQFGTAGSGILGGLGGGQGLLGGLGNALSGGLPNVLNIGANAAAAGGGVAATIGAAVPVLGALGLAFSLFRSRTKELDNGVRLTIRDMETAVATFETIEKRRFFGLSRKVRTRFTDAPPEVADPISQAVGGLQNTIVDVAAVLGIGAQSFEGFSYDMQLSLKGLDDAAKGQRINEELAKIADSFASVVVPPELVRDSEGAAAALQRLGASLSGANLALQTIDLPTFERSLTGAARASDFVTGFGSLEALDQAVTSYFTAILPETEQLEIRTNALRLALSDLGVVMPATIDGFRNLVDQAAAVGDMQRVGGLLRLSGGFAELLNQQMNQQNRYAEAAIAANQQGLRDAFTREQQLLRESFAASIEGLQDKLTSARTQLQQSRANADALTRALDQRVFPSAEAQRISMDRATADLAAMVQRGRIEDPDRLNQALQAVANASTDTYVNSIEYERDFARQTVLISQLKRVADIGLTSDEQTVRLLEDQLTQTSDGMAAQLLKLDEQLDALLGVEAGMLGLQEAITAFLQGQVQIARDVPNAEIANRIRASDLDTARYAANNPDLAAAGLISAEQLRTHFNQYGRHEVRRGVNIGGLDISDYAANNPDLGAAGLDTPAELIQHFIDFGQFENRPGTPFGAVATRFHRGGILGIGPDEVPFIGQRDEEILNRRDPRHRYNGGMANASNAELIAEIRAMRKDMERLRAQSETDKVYAKRMADILERMDTFGLKSRDAG